MTNRIYHLSTCDTCKRILRGIEAIDRFKLIDIKEKKITADDLDWIKKKVGSYEALFSKRARKYRLMGLHEKKLGENDYRKLMLEEYTFLKRPFIVYNDEVFIGNAPKVVEKAYQEINR